MTEEAKKVEESVEESAKAVEQAKAVVSETLGVAKEKLSEVSQAAGKRLQEVKGQAGEMSQVARDKAAEGLKQGYERVRKDFDDLNSDVNAYVRDNPGRSVLIAAGVGFLLGMMIRRDH